MWYSAVSYYQLGRVAPRDRLRDPYRRAHPPSVPEVLAGLLPARYRRTRSLLGARVGSRQAGGE